MYCTPAGCSIKQGDIIRYKNCLVLRNGVLEQDDLWVRGGEIIDPMMLFFKESVAPDITIECNGLIAAPGFIDLQLNGKCSVTYSYFVSASFQYGKLLFKITILKLFCDNYCCIRIEYWCSCFVVLANIVVVVVMTIITRIFLTIGGFGIDFSSFTSPAEAVKGVDRVSKEILKYGVTSFCPTLVTSPVEYYRMVSMYSVIDVNLYVFTFETECKCD